MTTKAIELSPNFSNSTINSLAYTLPFSGRELAFFCNYIYEPNLYRNFIGYQITINQRIEQKKDSVYRLWEPPEI